MKRIIYIAALLMAVIAAGCEKVVEFEVGDLETHVVLNAVPCADSTMFVNLSYSRFFLDNSQYLPVTGANITMWVNGLEVSPSSYMGGNYFFGRQVAEGDSLRITVTLDGREPITAATRVPMMPQIDSLTAIIDTTQMLTTLFVSFNLKDPAGENYYRFRLEERDSGSYWNEWLQRRDTIDTVSVTYFSCQDPELVGSDATASIPLLGSFFSEIMCNDIHYDGTDKKVTMAVMLLKDTSECEGYVRDYTLYVESLSKAYYRYLCDVANNTSLTSYFAEPEQLYTNVVGGLGIFGGTAKRKFALTPIYKVLEEGEKFR